MDLHVRQKRWSQKKAANMRKGVKEGRALSLSLGSMTIIIIAIVAVGGGLYLFQGSGVENGSESPEVGQEHPGVLATDFSLTSLDGNPFKLSDYRGSVVVIDFMATWCGPCRMEMPHYGTIWEKYGETIVIMSIDIDPNESEQTLRNFSQDFLYATWIWARDTFNLGQPYQVTAIPTTVIIDQDGYIRFTHIGVTSAATFIQEIDQLLL
jgi:thiol-disulfide isomerase/thioredoxin